MLRRGEKGIRSPASRHTGDVISSSGPGHAPFDLDSSGYWPPIDSGTFAVSSGTTREDTGQREAIADSRCAGAVRRALVRYMPLSECRSRSLQLFPSTG